MLPSPDFDSLYRVFPDAEGIPSSVKIAPDDMPRPYRDLLVHSEHMTVTVEAFYGEPVNVEVLQTRTEADTYSRKILLRTAHTGRVVQFGLVEIDLTQLAPLVREQIVAGKTPLGRVLIQNDVLRQVHPISFVQVSPTATMMGWFGLTEPVPLYGRLGVIETDSRPAIEVLEILAPVPSP